MKLQIPALLLILGLGFTACNSDRREDPGTDSLMTDSSLMDTDTPGSVIMDTANTDSLLRDTTIRDSSGPGR